MSNAKKVNIKPPSSNDELEDEAFPSAGAIPIPVERGPEIVATTLAPQLGSDRLHLSRGKFDMRKLSVIEEKDIPLLIYAKLRGRKSRVWRTIYNEFLCLRVSVGGRGRKDIIRMEGVSKGGLPEIPVELEKPGWLERNIFNRDWKKKLKEELP